MEWRFDADSTDADLLRFRFDDAVESLERWLADFAPAIAIEHTKDGTAAGYLRRIRVLTQDEAAAHGLQQSAPRMIYGGLDITSPKWADAFDAGEVPYVSPNIRALASTERSSEPAYPFAIGEVSFVTIPQVKAQQGAKQGVDEVAALGDRRLVARRRAQHCVAVELAGGVEHAAQVLVGRRERQLGQIGRAHV